MKVVVGIVALIVACTGFSESVVALSANVVISQMSAGNVASANNEFVEVYNNAPNDVDISNWCITYASSSGNVQTRPYYCFIPSDAVTQIFLRSKAYALITTPSYPLPAVTVGGMTGPLVPDGVFNDSGISGTSGHIILSSSLAAIDTLGWGTAPLAETAPSIAPTTSLSLQRKIVDTTMQETDNNLADFARVSPTLHTGGIYEVRTPIDLCAEISGVQEILPEGYGYDDGGNCELLSADICTNLENIQLMIPEGMLAVNSVCAVPVDLCTNIDNYQETVPVGYSVRSGECVKPSVLHLTELLPNVTGSDTGDEFIEIYNPTSEVVDLSLYQLRAGKDLEDSYQFPAGTMIDPGEYRAFYDSQTGLTLLNTTSRVSIKFFDGSVIDEATAYTDPRDDYSWSRIGSSWVYTDRVTPGSVNLPMTVLDSDTTVPVATGLAPCGPGKYRHPITNRCRNIESDTTMLVACENDEYRNPETNRCRKVLALASTLTPCGDGYERNIDTNRCRKIAGISTSLAACQAGYERNPATNRCRKSVSAAIAAIEPAVKDPSISSTTLMAVAGVGALGYGVYEWRSELARGGRRMKGLVIKR